MDSLDDPEIKWLNSLNGWVAERWWRRLGCVLTSPIWFIPLIVVVLAPLLWKLFLESGPVTLVKWIWRGPKSPNG